VKFGRVHPLEWIAALTGIAVSVGLALPWSGESAALSSPGFLDVLLLVVAAAAIVLPVSVAMSEHTNVPIVYETMLWSLSGLTALFMVVKAAFPPEGGFQSGFWLALAGTSAMSFALWRSVARER
jgi:hypothetical protein